MQGGHPAAEGYGGRLVRALQRRYRLFERGQRRVAIAPVHITRPRAPKHAIQRVGIVAEESGGRVDRHSRGRVPSIFGFSPLCTARVAKPCGPAFCSFRSNTVCYAVHSPSCSPWLSGRKM